MPKINRTVIDTALSGRLQGEPWNSVYARVWSVTNRNNISVAITTRDSTVSRTVDRLCGLCDRSARDMLYHFTPIHKSAKSLKENVLQTLRR